MILNIVKVENGRVVTPEVEFGQERRRKLAIITLNCILENSLDHTEIVCLKSNLIPRSLGNPDQILCFFTVHNRYITFGPAQLTFFQMMSNTFHGGFFYLESFETGQQINIESAAMQITVQSVNNA